MYALLMVRMWYICLLVVINEMKKKQPKVNLYLMPPGIDFGKNCLGFIIRPLPGTSSGRNWHRWSHYHIEIWKINQRRPIR